MQGPADIWKPALIAGAVFGFISGVPFLGALNCACCSLIVGAGAVAAFMVVRASVVPVTWGRAALVGLVAGVIAAPVQSATSFLVTTAILGVDPEKQIQDALSQFSDYAPDTQAVLDVIDRFPMILWVVMSTVFLMFLYAPIGAIGGVIGRALFEKRAAPPPAPTENAPTILA
jgi:hypothetical protein